MTISHLIETLLYIAAVDLWNTQDDRIPWEVWCDINCYCWQYEQRSPDARYVGAGVAS